MKGYIHRKKQGLTTKWEKTYCVLTFQAIYFTTMEDKKEYTNMLAISADCDGKLSETKKGHDKHIQVPVGLGEGEGATVVEYIHGLALLLTRGGKGEGREGRGRGGREGGKGEGKEGGKGEGREGRGRGGREGRGRGGREGGKGRGGREGRGRGGREGGGEGGRERGGKGEGREGRGRGGREGGGEGGKGEGVREGRGRE